MLTTAFHIHLQMHRIILLLGAVLSNISLVRIRGRFRRTHGAPRAMEADVLRLARAGVYRQGRRIQPGQCRGRSDNIFDCLCGELPALPHS